MSSIIINLAIAATSVGAGVLGTVFIFRNKNFINVEKTRAEADEMIRKSKEEAENILKEMRVQAGNIKERTAEETAKKEERIKKMKASLLHKEDALKKREEKIQETRLREASYREELQSRQNAISTSKKKMIDQLSALTAQPVSELKSQIIEEYKRMSLEDNAKRMADTEDMLKENAHKIAEKILINTMQRLCSPTSVETRSVLIKVPKDQIKGKIVGKDATNIAEFESLLDVAVVFNDLPNTISLSGYNLVTRRIAEKAIEKLIRKRGGITPEIVRLTVDDAKKETSEELYEIGKKALEKMGIETKDRELTRTVGRLKFRTSYGQNIMKHSMEVAWLASMLGSEIGLDAEICKEAGFLHDLGKAIDQDPDVKDAHDQLTKELMTKYGFSEEKIHAAWAHHDAEPQKTAEALIVKAADSISGGRPGARQDSIERYIERIQAIDSTVNSFEGVKKSFTMSAGREVRVFVDPEKVADGSMAGMAKDIAQKVEENVVFPGKIKIKVIRRTKNMEIAK
ncbi:MAG: Rnase Y domain-containing protein [Candidatus Peregrinibacteria bacterium]